MAYSIGIDYGTNSVRALVVDCSNGKELGTSVVEYPSGHQGILLDPKDHHLARQNPADYLIGLEKSVKGALQEASNIKGFSPQDVVGIGIDATGSSPIPVNGKNVPLSFDAKFKSNLSAQCWLWKDHTSHQEALLITEFAAKHRPHFIAKCGNGYSSEWFWSKILHCLNIDPKVFDAAYSWVELADFVPSVLAGVTDPKKIVRGVCAAGHKGLYCDEWGGLPEKEFLSMLNPKLAELRDRLFEKAHDALTPAGKLCPEWAKKLGLPEGIAIAIGEIDVHYGSIGSGIEEGVVVKAIGTSTCDCCVVSASKKVEDIPGISGIVKGSILPGFYAIEAGQSAVGDIFKWWVEVVCKGSGAMHAELVKEVESQKPGQHGLIALDWNNGNRNVLLNPMLTGLVLGQTLHTTRAEIYRALIEATAFGARKIIEQIKKYGVPVNRMVCCGGIAEKNPFLMQVYADVLGIKMQLAGSSQAGALGGAVAASVVAGIHPDFPMAQKAMTSLKDKSWSPIPENQKVYNHLFEIYGKIHDAFGGVNKSADLSGIMIELGEIKKEQINAPSKISMSKKSQNALVA